MEPRKLYLSRDDKKLCGVCGGIAEYFNVDSTLVRLAAVVLGLGSAGVALIGYFIAAIIIPNKPELP